MQQQQKAGQEKRLGLANVVVDGFGMANKFTTSSTTTRKSMIEAQKLVPTNWIYKMPSEQPRQSQKKNQTRNKHTQLVLFGFSKN